MCISIEENESLLKTGPYIYCYRQQNIYLSFWTIIWLPSSYWKWINDVVRKSNLNNL